MFDADRPITKSHEDQLDRTVFAQNLARALSDNSHNESMVVGLFGAPGSGKTSLINLVIEELLVASQHVLDEEKPIIVNFSAWSYANRARLTIGFYQRLMSAIESAPAVQHRREIMRLLTAYIQFFTEKPKIKPLTWWDRFRKNKKNITQIKLKLNYYLAKQKHKIIIAIDNISRLSGDEIREVFQLIKSMANFFNTAYLVSLSKKRVIRALDVSTEVGNTWLQTMVQLIFTVPSIAQHELKFLLENKLQPLKALIPQDKWNASRWAAVYEGVLKGLFKHVRDVTRFVNLLYFAYPRLVDVVNPVDFFALTAIEIFSPSLYAAIRENKDLFSDLFDPVYPATPATIQLQKKRYDEIVDATLLPEKVISPLLTVLFPRLQLFDHADHHIDYSGAEADQWQRICSANWFNRYFALSLLPNKLSRAQCLAILSMANDLEQFDQIINGLNQDRSISHYLSAWDNADLLQAVPEANIANIISVLLDNGDLFSLSDSHIIYILLNRIAKKEERFLLLQQAITRAEKSIYVIVNMLPRLHLLLTDEQLTTLKGLAAAKIAAWGADGRLAAHPQLLALLQAWLAWGSANECQQYVKKLTEDDRGLLYFLAATLDPDVTMSMTQYKKGEQWQANLNTLQLFIAPQDCAPRAVSLFEGQTFETLSEHDQVTLLVFLDLMKVKTKKVFPKVAE